MAGQLDDRGVRMNGGRRQQQTERRRHGERKI
jgi:hypothetical protein